MDVFCFFWRFVRFCKCTGTILGWKWHPLNGRLLISALIIELGRWLRCPLEMQFCWDTDKKEKKHIYWEVCRKRLRLICTQFSLYFWPTECTEINRTWRAQSHHPLQHFWFTSCSWLNSGLNCFLTTFGPP